MQLLTDYDEDWLSELSVELERLLGARGLDRIMGSWNLSATALGELFGVSRQAVSKWLDEGIPADRSTQVADLEAMADILEHYLKPQRIPAVLRRTAPGLGGLSLLEMISEGRSPEALALTRRMFTFGDTHS
ncbi:MAG: hypothetical protein ACK5O2_08250 [Microthrixaceae bacterium]